MAETAGRNADGLTGWYKEQLLSQAKEAKRSRRRLFGLIYFYIGYIILYLVLLIVVMIFRKLIEEESMYMSAESRETGISPAVINNMFFTILILLGIAFIIYALAKNKMNLFRNLVENGLLRPFKPNEGQRMKSVVTGLCGKMAIDEQRLVFWKTTATTISPSIEEDKNGAIHLIIPAGFFMYAVKYPERAEAVLAHELGHVLQKDTQLYLVSTAYLKVLRSILAPLLQLNIAVKIILLFTLDMADSSVVAITVTLPIDFIALLILAIGGSRVKDARRQSELLADTAAVIYADGRKLAEVLQEFREEKATAVHPPKAERLAHISKVMTEYAPV